MNIYLINLDRDTERLAFVARQLTALGIDFERVPAICGTAMPEWLKPYFLTSDGRIASDMTAGEVGCYASHLLVMRRIAEGNQPALVLEDDVEIGAALPGILARTDDLPSGWDIVRLSNPSKRRHFTVKGITEEHEVVKFGSVPPSTGAYLITPRGAHKFLTYRSLRTMPVDQDLRHIWNHGLATYGIYPRPVTPDKFGASSIATFGEIKRGRKLPISEGIKRISFETGWLGMRNWLLARL